MPDIKQMIDRINAFRDERNWRQFHNPKNLAMALSVEAAEIVEQFQWLTLEQSLNLDEEKKKKVQHELADVAIYLLYLCNDLEIDIVEAIENKMEINAKKYPVESTKDSAKKYNEQ